MDQFSVFIVFILFGMLLCVQGEFNMTAYYKMPPLYKLDDFDRCMQELPVKSIYCFSRTQIKPNESSELWSYIHEFSNNTKHHFRHDRLNRGVCMNRCRTIFDRFPRVTKRRYFVAQFDNFSETDYDPNTIPGALYDREHYNNLINMCINYDLIKEYNLMAYSSIEYCIKSTDHFEIDTCDYIFLSLLICLVSVIVISTAYDFHLKLKGTEGVEHYKKDIKSKTTSIMVSFSLPRNWYRLIGKPQNETSIDLRPMHAIRFFTMFGVIIGHCGLVTNILPVLNPQYMESNFYRFVTMILINGTVIIQTFFAITGFLLSIQFMKLREMKKFSLHYFWKFILYRYIRLFPVYVFLILLHSTWLAKGSNGPLWPYAAYTERSFCRNAWWTNLLYINNIVSTTEPCLQHSWYLAADFQLFVIGVALHLLFWKFPQCMKSVLSLAILVSFIVPSVLTYIYKYEGIFMVTPESQRYAHWYDEMYKIVYIPFYTNMGSFFCGTIGGILYHKYKQEKIDVKSRKVFVIIWCAMFPMALTLIMSGYLFYAYEFTKPKFWIAIYSAILKNLWGLFTTVLISGMAFGIGWIIRDLLCQPIFRPLGRLTYCAYLIHPTVIRLSFGSIRQPSYASDMTLWIQTTSTSFQSYLVAILLCICIELPISTLQRQFSRKLTNPPSISISTETTDNDVELNNTKIN